MRNLYYVIQEMLNNIPDTEIHLKRDLKSAQDSFTYAAPEAAGMWWNETAKRLGYHITKPVEPWQIKVVSIWTTMTEDEVVNQYG